MAQGNLATALQPQGILVAAPIIQRKVSTAVGDFCYGASDTGEGGHSANEAENNAPCGAEIVWDPRRGAARARAGLVMAPTAHGNLAEALRPQGILVTTPIIQGEVAAAARDLSPCR